eukprot:TRINITY_DN2538_c0_g1_i1.p1 TRINITY_DN2538_c0_g1~~TRINITY_DN2538_c0_g1_i1.p1  ORF type:complete len:487 (-),score=54.38 TRINITY_DN2538_c0_g1_i1:72-1460(-)
MATLPESQKRLLLQKIASEADLDLVGVLLDIVESCSKGTWKLGSSAHSGEEEAREHSQSAVSVATRLDLARAFAQQLAASLYDFDNIGRFASAVEKRDLSIMTTLDCKASSLERETMAHAHQTSSVTLSEEVILSAARIGADMAALAVSFCRNGKQTEFEKMNKMREELHKHASEVFNESDRSHSLEAQTDAYMERYGKPVCIRIQNAVTGDSVAELQTHVGNSGWNLRRQLSEELQDCGMLRAQFLYDSKVIPLGAPLWLAFRNDDEIPEVVDLQMTISTSGSFEKVSCQNHDVRLKVLLVGNCGVGKTCLMNRFVDDTYTANYISTVGLDFRVDTRKFDDDRVVKVQVWDISGQDRYRRGITSAHYRDCNGCAFVFDITDRGTFDAIDEWYAEFCEGAGPSALGLVLVGTKADLEDERQVSTAEAQAWARLHAMQYVETSSKQGASVDSAFDELVSRCLH